MTRLLSLGEDSLHHFATVPPSTSNFIPQTVDDWCGAEDNPPCISIDLTPWAGIADLQVVFETFNGFGNNIFIDNIKVDGTLSGITNVQDKTDPVSLFPNPSGGAFTLKINGIAGIIIVKISDLTGRAVYQRSFNSDGNTSSYIDLQDTGRGVYVVEVSANANVWVKKMVVR
jgi:hypothetical protein